MVLIFGLLAMLTWYHTFDSSVILHVWFHPSFAALQFRPSQPPNAFAGPHNFVQPSNLQAPNALASRFLGAGESFSPWLGAREIPGERICKSSQFRPTLQFAGPERVGFTVSGSWRELLPLARSSRKPRWTHLQASYHPPISSTSIEHVWPGMSFGLIATIRFSVYVKANSVDEAF